MSEDNVYNPIVIKMLEFAKENNLQVIGFKNDFRPDEPLLSKIVFEFRQV
jgi:hypothetical protein